MITEKKNHKIKSVDFSIKNKKIAFCSELPFWILSFNSYLSIESMNVISSDVQTNEYKLLNIKSSCSMHALWLFEIS